MQQPNMRIRPDNFLTIEFENESQHAVGGGVLWTEVDGVVADLAVLGDVAVVRCEVHLLRAIFVYRVSKSLVYGNKPSTFAHWLGESPLKCGGETSGEGASEGSSGSGTEAFGGVGSQADER